MRHVIMGSIAAALAISATAPHTLAAQPDQSTAAGTLGLPKASAAPLGISEVQLLRRMSDANILGHLAIMDSVEIVLSEWTAGLSKSDAVIKYAKEMDAAYRNNVARDYQLGQQTGIGLTTMAGELHRSHIGPAIDSVQNASDVNLDRLYMLSQVQLHAHMLSELETLQSVARNPVIRAHVTGQLPIVQDELTRARAIAVSKGYLSNKSK